jgi:hypothetical protein
MSTRFVPAVAAASTAALLTLLPTPASAQDELSLEKYVAAVNEAAPQADRISIVVGDTITYGLAVSGAPSLAGTDVTVTDVFEGTALQFEGAVGGSCVQEDVDTDGRIVCTLTLPDAGSTEVLLTFSAIAVDGGCRELLNRAQLVAGEAEPITAETTVEVCPAREGTAAGTPGDDTGAAASGGTSQPAEGGDDTGSGEATQPAAGDAGSGAGQPNTALPVGTGDPDATLIQAGAMLLFSGAAWIVLRACPRTALEEIR